MEMLIFAVPFSSTDLGLRRGNVTVVVSAVSTGAEAGLGAGLPDKPGFLIKDGADVTDSATLFTSSSLNWEDKRNINDQSMILVTYYYYF